MPILSTNLTGDSPSFLMPLAKRNLRQEINTARGKNEVPVSALADILNSLERLHALGYVHRDLKPENVLFHRGSWKLCDFGLVLPTSAVTTRLSSLDSAWGTAAYCAPEQASDFFNATYAVDIYAFGCILHDIFEAKSRVPYSRQTGDGAIGRVIEKCTEIEAVRRFKNIPTLRSALLTILSSQSTLQPSATAEEWVEKLKSLHGWNKRQLEDLVRYIRSGPDFSDRWTVFRALEEELIHLLWVLDPSLWKILALEYAEWVKESSFDFTYCDVLLPRLEMLIKIGDFDVKSTSLIAAAQLGRSHNRWYVMGRVVRLCGPSMDDQLAERLAIEILVEGAKRNFIECAKRSSVTIQDYHLRLAEILKDEGEIV